MSRARGAVLLLSWIVVIGCSSELITTEDLAGKWVLSSESRRRLPEQPSQASAELLLHRDGTFQAIHVPADMLYLEQSAPVGAVSGNGRWKLLRESGRQMLSLQFLEIQRVRRSDIPYAVSLHVARRRGAFRIYYFRDDPDEGNLISFSKGE